MTPSQPSEPPSRLPGFLSAFAFSGYRLLWTGAFVSSLGTWTQDVALSWLIHTDFKNPFYLGLRSFTERAPLMAFMLVGGAVADRVDRRLILLTSQSLQMTFAIVLLGLYGFHALGLGTILAIAFLTGLTQSQSAPTYQAVITSLVPPRQIPNAVALNSLQFNLSRAIGPVIAGILLARVGTGSCFGANAVSYLAVIYALSRIPKLPPASAPREGLGRSLLSGLRFVRESPVLSTLTLLGAAGSFLGFPLITYLPVVADEALGTGAAGYSLLLSSFGAGAIAGAVATAQRGHVPGRGRTALFCLASYGISTTLAVLSGRQALAMTFLFVSGVSLVSAFSIFNSLVQENVPDALRGRALSVYGLAFRGGGPIGSLLAGLAVGPWGAPAVIGTLSLTLALLALGLRLRGGALARI